MNLEDVLNVADEAVFDKTGNHLTNIQEFILRQSWNNQTYQEMTKVEAYQEQTLKNEGMDLWNLLTEALGEKVSKKNFRAALERYQRQLHKPEENSVPRTLPVSPTSNSEEEIDALVQEVRKKVRPYYEERYNILKVLGMREPVKLESVYTAVNFLNSEAILSFDSIDNLEQHYRQGNRRKFQSQDKGKQEGIKVANEKQYLMVLGGPGAGKSTFLRKIGLEALKAPTGKFNHDCIPIFIELKSFQDRDINIENFIVKEFSTCQVPDPENFTTKALKKGKLLILLDGLDEVPTKNLNNIISHIQEFVEFYKENRFIASCRLAAYRHNFQRFTDVAMADFDIIQIQNFINNWFSSQPEEGKDLWEKLNSEDYTAAKELTQTPLLLTLICLLYQRSGKIPTNRATLYERALRVLLEEWAAEKIGVNKDVYKDVYKGLDTKCKEIILSEIAHDAFQEDRVFLPRREIVKKIENILAEMLPDEKSINGESVLKSIEVQHGVLVERADSIYSFSHLTLQEYLTARYIDDKHQIKKLVTEHLTDSRWQEVFLLVAGLMSGGSNDLLLLMEKETQRYINTPRLRALFNWAEHATTGSTVDLKPAGKCVVAIVFANANAKAYGYANANANAIVNAIAKAKAYAITNANVYANVYADAIANANVYADAIANAKADAYAKAYAYAKADAKADAYAKAKAYADAITKAIADTINYIGTLEKLTIFNNVNFTMLIDKLNKLKTKIPAQKLTKEEHQKFIQSLEQTLFSGFNLSLDMIDLSQEEFNALEYYFYANKLLIECKQASVRVSPTTWEGIEARMLLVPGN